MQDIVFAAVVDSLDALKAASKGVPNTLLRDIGAIHTNSTFSDLPKELQATITASVRGAFNRLLKEGYSVAPRDAAAPPPRQAPSGQPHRPPRSGPPGGGRRPPRGGGKPGGGPDPNRKPGPRRPSK